MAADAGGIGTCDNVVQRNATLRSASQSSTAMKLTFSKGALPKLNLTDEERRIFNLLFKQADTKNDGIVTGEVAVTLFPRTKIPENTLGEVWHTRTPLDLDLELTADRYGQWQTSRTVASCWGKTLQRPCVYSGIGRLSQGAS
jgi:hypothetical protein